MEATNQQDAGVYAMGLSAADAPKRIGSVPGVTQTSSSEDFLAMPNRPGASFDFTITASPDPTYGHEMSRPVLKSGRLPSPSAPHEVVLNRPAARSLRLGVGDRFAVQTITPAAFDRMVNHQGGPVLDGPTIPLRVVGIVQLGEDLQGSTHQSGPQAIASSAFYRAETGRVAVNGSNTEIKFTDAGTLDRVRSVLSPYEHSQAATIGERWADTARSSIDVITIGLLVFAVIALVAGAVAAGQAISRQVSAESEQLLAVRAVGLTRRERVTAIGLPVFTAAAIGTSLGAVVAAASSGIFPFAVARNAEVDPGLRIDPIVLGIGLAALLAALAGWTYFAARRRDILTISPRRAPPRVRSVRSRGSGPGSGRASGCGWPSTAAAGARPLPPDPRCSASFAGIAGVVAALVFIASLHGAIESPAQYGWTWSTRPDVSSDDPNTTLDRMAKDPDLDARWARSSRSTRGSPAGRFRCRPSCRSRAHSPRRWSTVACRRTAARSPSAPRHSARPGWASATRSRFRPRRGRRGSSASWGRSWETS